jgi:hypothetical protein
MVSNSASQILLAILVLIILFAVGVMIYSADQVRAIRQAGRQKKTVPIFVGIKDLKNNNDEEYNTLEKNPNNPNYRDIGNSINQPSGAEFTYNFWLYTDPDAPNQTVFKQNTSQMSTNNTAVSPDVGLKEDQIILFVRGSKTPVSYKNLCDEDKNDILVKCPLVKLENNGDILTVEFNTMQGPDAIVENSISNCDTAGGNTNWGSVNSYKLSVKGISSRPSLTKKWNMITVVIRDTFPDDPYPLRNKVRCSIYVNGGVELDKYVDGKFYSQSDVIGKSIIRENQGNLYFAPLMGTVGTSPIVSMPVLSGLKDKQLMVADLTFFNYAISTYEAKALFSKKLTKEYAAAYGKPVTKVDDKAWMSDVSIDTRNNKLYSITS